MRWLVLYQCEDADPKADPSPHLVLVVPLLLLLVLLLLLLLLGVLSSVIRGVLHLLLPPQVVLLLKNEM
jgi:hypothetical protein